MCSGKVSSSCSSIVTRRVTIKQHEYHPYMYINTNNIDKI